MAYKFKSKLENIFKVLKSEDERSQSEILALKNSIKELDAKKQGANAPVKCSQHLWDLASNGNQPKREILQAIVRLENACILADQYIEFVKASRMEVDKLTAQLLIQLKLYEKKPIDEYRKIFYDIPLEDCNEIFRYIKVWDVLGFVYPKYNFCIRDGSSAFYEFDDGNLFSAVQELGYAKYVCELRRLYTEKVRNVNKVYVEFNETFGKLEYSIKEINKAMKYTHYVPLNYNDGTRQPIGHDDDTKHQKAMQQFYKEYKASCNKSKDIDLSR